MSMRNTTQQDQFIKECQIDQRCTRCHGKMIEFHKPVNNGKRNVWVKMYRCIQCGYEHN